MSQLLSPADLSVEYVEVILQGVGGGGGAGTPSVTAVGDGGSLILADVDLGYGST